MNYYIVFYFYFFKLCKYLFIINVFIVILQYLDKSLCFWQMAVFIVNNYQQKKIIYLIDNNF
jgi:hypothetical protein